MKARKNEICGRNGEIVVCESVGFWRCERRIKQCLSCWMALDELRYATEKGRV